MKFHLRKPLALLLSLALLIPLFSTGLALTSTAATKVKIYIDQGHNPTGNHNSGAVGYSDESLTNYKVGIVLNNLLTADGRFEIKLSRPTETTVLGTNNSTSLSARSSAANSWGADYFISLHCNAGGGTGIEAYSYAQDKAWTLGQKIVKELCDATGLAMRKSATGGMATNTSLAVLNSTSMPAVLLEMGFVDNATDAAFHNSDSGINTLATAIYKGILAFFGYSANTSSGLTLDTAYTDGRAGVCYYGNNGLTGQATQAAFGILWAQSTNQGGYTYNTGASYNSAVSFNTFTVFKANTSYGNAKYAEIWYYNGTPTGADPLTYWTKATVKDVIVSNATEATSLLQNVYAGGSVTEAYTWVLSEPVTAKHIMVNFVYDASRASGEGHVFQMISFAGYDSDYASSGDVTTSAPETEPPTPSTEPTEDTVNTLSDVYFTTTHDANYANMTLSMKDSMLAGGSVNAFISGYNWAADQRFMDGTTPYTWFLAHSSAKWINQVKMLAKSLPAQRILNTVGVYTSNDGVNWTTQYGTWTNATGEGDYFTFNFDEAACAKYVMLHMETPSTNISANWTPNTNVVTSYIVPKACEHTDCEWIIINDATCTAAGQKAQVCSSCNETITTATIPATGHTAGDWSVVTNATCTTAGRKVKTCTTCGVTVSSATISATGHTAGNWRVVTNATCTTAGQKVQTCTTCGVTVSTEVIPATDHTPGAWTVTVQPNGSQPGERVRKCTACGEILATEPIYGEPDIGGDGDTDKILADVPAEMTVDELKDYYSSLGYEITVSANGEYVGTGSTVTIGDEVYEVVVKGDATGDGIIDIFDLLELLNYANGESSMEGAFVKAGLIDDNDEVDIFDLLALLAYANGEGQL